MRRLLVYSFAFLTLTGLIGVSLVLGFVAYEAAKREKVDKIVAFVEPPPSGARRFISPFRVGKVGERHEVIDDEGRVVFFRGFVTGPLRGEYPFGPVPMGQDEAFEKVKSFGFNTLVLRVPWSALEETPRTINLEVIRYVRWFVEAASRHDLSVIVANDLRGESRCNIMAGVPTWAYRNRIEGICDKGLVSQLRGLASAMRWFADFYEGLWTQDDLALQDHMIWAFVKLAEALQRERGLLGYALLVGARCPSGPFEVAAYPGKKMCEVALADFTRRMAGSLRAVDEDALFFFEPSPRPFTSELMVEGPVIPAPDSNSVAIVSFSLDSDLPKGVTEEKNCPFAAFLSRWQKASNDVLYTPLMVILPREVSSSEAEALAIHAEADIERAMTSVAFEGVFREGVRCNFRALVRPWPWRVAGIPLRFFFDRLSPPLEGSDTFEIRVRSSKVFGESVIFLPRVFVYGEDETTEAPEFVVEVSDGTWRFSERNRDILLWRVSEEGKEHSLVVRPWGGQKASGKGPAFCP